MKKRDWTIRRHGVVTADAQQRWDQAYQRLVRWSTTAGLQETGSAPAGASRQEENHEDCYVCTGLDPTTSPNPNY